MRYLPINLDISGRRIVVVGGGPVAARKCRALLAAGGEVTVIAPGLALPLCELAEMGRIRHISRGYAPGDLDGAFLVYAATDSREINGAVLGEARERGILAEITDAPDLCSFISPAQVSRGELLITVSTGGNAPLLSSAIREELEGRYGPEYGVLTEILGRVREKLLTEKVDSQYNKQIFRSIIDCDLPGLLRCGAYHEIDRILERLCGPGFTMTELGIGKKDNK